VTARPSAAEKGGARGSPQNTTQPQHAHAQKKAKRGGQAERSEEGEFGGLPRLRQSNLHARRRRQSRAQRPGRAQRRSGVRGSPSTTTAQLARAPEKAKPSKAARPSAAEKGGSWVSPDCDSTTRPGAKEAKLSDHAERFGKRVPLDRSSIQRAAKARTNAKRPTACKTTRRYGSFSLICPRIRALLVSTDTLRMLGYKRGAFNWSRSSRR
jgi:hypothetical protein